jgi:oligoribonuclease
MTRTNTNLIFVDLETTGLDANSDVILEIAALPVDQNLNVLHEGWSAVVHPILAHGDWDRTYDAETPGWLLSQLQKEMSPVVLDMHTNNGLFDDIAAGKAITLREATTQFIRYAEQFVPHGETPIAGSTVHFDRKFLEKYMVSVDRFFHYRIADVSCIKEFWKRWFPEAGEPPKVKAHRALADCHLSVKEALWYKDHLRTTNWGPKEITDDERRILREIDEQMRHGKPVTLAG